MRLSHTCLKWCTLPLEMPEDPFISSLLERFVLLAEGRFSWRVVVLRGVLTAHGALLA